MTMASVFSSMNLRSFRKSPGLVVTIVLLLALGIGANTALFSLFSDVLLRSVPGASASAEFVRIRRTLNGKVQGNQSYPDYRDIQKQTQTLDGLAAERSVPLLFNGSPAQIIPSAIVTGNYFQVLGVKAAAGRLLNPEDDRVPGGHPVVVVSEAYWSNKLGRDPAIVGRKLILNGRAFTVVGVAAAPFQGVEFGEATSIWLPMMMVREVMTRNPTYSWLTERRSGWLTYYGRLKPGVTLKAVGADLDIIARRLEHSYPESNAGRGFQVSAHANMSPEQRASAMDLLVLLSAAVCIVLLITCGNVACLLLARAAARVREMSIRLALGAGRWDLMWQMLAESVLLGIGGCALGLAIAPQLLLLLQKSWGPGGLSSSSSSILDPHVLGFAFGVSFFAVLLFGIAPAWMTATVDLSSALKASSPQTGRTRGWLQRGWVIAQVTLSVALVTGGSLVLRSMQKVLAIDPGYRADQVVMASMDLSILGYSAERGTQFYLNLAERVASLPGVRSVSLGKASPAVDWSDRVVAFREGEAPESGRTVSTDMNIVAPAYFRTLGIPLVAGRDFNLADRAGSQAVAIVSKTLASSLWPGENPIGKKIMAMESRAAPESLMVIGVAADSRYRSVLAEPSSLLYVPLTQNYDSIARLMVSVNGDPASFKGALRHAIEQANPDLPIRTIDTLPEQVSRSLWRRRAALWLLTLFGALGLTLACAGVHGVVAYSTMQRTREIGIRMALGADRASVSGLVLRQALKLAGAGIVLGLPMALWSKPLLASFLYGAGLLEPMVLAAVPVLFGMIAAAASFGPARRAAAIDPAITLRQE
jgi:macrolide transport system ATP-binding/permease protein